MELRKAGRRTLHAALTSLLLAIGCGPPDQVLARLGDQEITLADLDAYLLTLPEAERRLPDGSDPAEWITDKLEALALERCLESSAEAGRLAASPETAWRRQHLRAGALVQALMAELAAAVEPDRGEVLARADSLAARPEREPLLSFRHIYIRLDRAADDAERHALELAADELARQVAAGADFEALARQHSDSVTAAEGGLVANAPASALDTTTAATLASLQEGEVSPLVRTRTGLHLFKLERRTTPTGMSQARLEQAAREAIVRERLAEQRSELLAEARPRLPVTSSEQGFGVGSWEVPAAALAGQPAGTEEALTDQLLLAEIALERGLDSPELEARIEGQLRSERLKQVFWGRRGEVDDAIAEDDLHAFYEVRPSRFEEAGQTRLELLFVPQGQDSFATQQVVEGYVSRLRAGASFADFARSASQGPAAAEGGDLGWLEAKAVQRLGPAVAEVVNRLEPGEISDPVYCTDRMLSRDPMLLKGGFAVVRVGERQPPRQRSFTEAIEDVRKAYLADHNRELNEKLGDRILERAGFEVVRVPAMAEFVR